MLSIRIHAVCLVGLLACATAAFAQQGPSWPQFLGPQRNGVSAEKGVTNGWASDADAPKQVWRVPGGVGMSGLAVADGRVITLGQGEGKQYVLALAEMTGKTLWKTPVAPAYENSMGDGPRATPTIDGKTVYAYTGEGVLTALDAASGELLWRVDAVRENESRVSDYGMASSPLVVGDKVIVTVGAPGPTVVAYNKKSGEAAWQAGGAPNGYSSPALLEVGGAKQIVVFAGAAGLGVSPADGALLWRYPYVTDYNCNTATPIAVGGDVFLSSGENHGSVLLSLTGKNSGGFDVKPVWESLGGGSVMRNEWQTSVLVDGYLYGFDNVGSAGPVTHLTCIEAASGKPMWRQARFGKGNLIYADGKLLISTFDGDFVVVRASPKEFNELGRMTATDGTRQAPSLADGRVYLRDNREVVCLDVRAK
ncbi:MAG: PQQ-binding-like beta-propeller repeat protein [Pirellulaceae bacterium]